MDPGELNQTQVDDLVKGFVALSCKIVELEVQYQSKGVPPDRKYRDQVIALTRQMILSTKPKLEQKMGADLLSKAGKSMDRLDGGAWFEVEDKIKGYYKSLVRNIK